MVQTSPLIFSSLDSKNEATLLAQQSEEIDAIQADYIFCIDQIVIEDKSHKKKISNLVKRAERNLTRLYEAGIWGGPLDDISKFITADLVRKGYPKTQLHNIASYVEPEHKHPYESKDFSDKDFSESQSSVFDKTQEYSNKPLTDPQLQKLSDAEYKDVVSNEISARKSRKTVDNDRIKHLQENADKRGIVLVDKVTKARPPEVYAGQSECYDALGDLERVHDVLSNMFKDLKQQVYSFKPNPKDDRKALHELETHCEKSFIPYLKVAYNYARGIETIMKNITDEKYSDTNQGWMRNAEDKFLAWGNHGSGEVNAVLTNRVILKLGYREFKDEEGDVIKVIPVIIKVQIKRETTREEIGDKTLFEPQGVLDIHCPNHIDTTCIHCNGDIHLDCNLDFNRPYYPDDMVDFIAGDLFEQAKTTLLSNGLSNAIDILANTVIVEPVRDPIDWFNEQIAKNPLPNGVDPKDVIIEEGKPEKIKTVDINFNDVCELRHSILSNAATRRADKAEHFSKEA